jgi:hypothetical protein
MNSGSRESNEDFDAGHTDTFIGRCPVLSGQSVPDKNALVRHLSGMSGTSCEPHVISLFAN